MHLQPSLYDYYGYNSILNQQGKRVRRMRRTEASLQKLFQSKIKTLPPSRSISSKRSQVSLCRNNNSSSLSRFDSNLKLANANLKSNTIMNASSSVVRKTGHKVSDKLQLQPSGIKQNKVVNVKLAMGQYFIGDTPQQSQTNRSNSKQAVNLNGLSINTSPRRTLNKTEKTKTVISPFQLQENKSKPQASNRALPRKGSNSRLMFSKSNSRLGKISINEGSNIKSIISDSDNSKLSNHVHFQQKLKDVKDRQKEHLNEDYQFSSIIKQSKSSLINKESVNSPSSISSHSEQTSKISSCASKIRSKIQKKQESIHINNSSENVKVKVDKGNRMIKKQTQATESNLSQQNSHIQSIETSKSRVVSIVQKTAVKNKFNPQNGSFLKESSKHSDYKEKQQPITLAPLPLAKMTQNMIITKKKSMGSYTFNDVVQNIEEHQIRLGSIYLFIDSTKNKYQSSIKFQRYERLCFLMLKKYLLEKNRMIRSLRGQENCFILTNAQIPSQVLKKHMNRQQVRQRMSGFSEEEKQISLQLKAQFYKISAKYQKDKFIKLQAIRDNFSPQIMRLLMGELTKLYQQLQQEDAQNELIDANEQRIIEIVEIMFLMSELNGRSVKPFQLYEQEIVDFQQYYSQNYQSIMETAQYFEKHV